MCDSINTLTTRDLEILKAVNRYHYMRSSQIQRLLFIDNTTPQNARRRLKSLCQNGLLGKLTTGHDSGGTAYYLGKSGADLLHNQGETVNLLKAKLPDRHFINHALDVSEFRLNIELAIQESAIVKLHRFTCGYEVKSHTKGLTGKQRFKLYDEATHTASDEWYTIHPAALFILRGKGKYERHQQLYFLEFAHVGQKAIREKVIGYNLYRRQRGFAKYGRFESFKVLLLTTSEKKTERIRKSLTGLEGADLLWITSVDQVNEKTILSSPIWLDHEWGRNSVLKSGG